MYPLFNEYIRGPELTKYPLNFEVSLFKMMPCILLEQKIPTFRLQLLLIMKSMVITKS